MKLGIGFALLATTVALLPTTLSAQIQLQPCEQEFGERAGCGWVAVPENRASASGRTLQIRVVVLESRSGESAEPLLLFPGGPGQATTALIGLAQQVYPSVQDTRDVVFIGQRGAGESNAMNCVQDLSSDPPSAFGGLWDPELIGSCHAKVVEHANPNHYTTADYVADISDALDELGYDEVMLWGGSGGTRTAAAFIREFPDRVVAAAMDGVTSIDFAMPAPFSQFVQTSWQHVVEDCAGQPTCHEAFPNLSDDLTDLLARFSAGPVQTTVRDAEGNAHDIEFHRGDFLYALRGILYNPQLTASLPLRIHDAAETEDLSFFAQSLFNRSVSLLSGVLSVGLHLSVYCSEDVPRISSDDIEATEGTLVGTYLIEQYRGACEAWPVEPMPDDWFRSFESDVPTLFISGYYDPSTPQEAAELVRRSLPNSKHIVVRNAGHGAGFGCAKAGVEAFLVSGDLDDVTDTCPKIPITFEVPKA